MGKRRATLGNDRERTGAGGRRSQGYPDKESKRLRENSLTGESRNFTANGMEGSLFRLARYPIDISRRDAVRAGLDTNNRGGGSTGITTTNRGSVRAGPDTNNRGGGPTSISKTNRGSEGAGR